MKENKTLKNKWLHLRLSEAEYEQIQQQFCQTTERKLSGYARKIMLGIPMIKGQRNLSLDQQVNAFSGLLRDLNGLSNNFNQAVHKLNSLKQMDDFKKWFVTYELEKRTLLKQVEEIKSFINQKAEEWLQS